jgi:hypothetical protein
MMIVGLSKHMTNELACKSKWGTISRKFKIFEYTLGTSHNERLLNDKLPRQGYKALASVLSTKMSLRNSRVHWKSANL